MQIRDLAAAAGVKPSLVRYYEERGVLPPPPRTGGARRYGVRDLERLRSVLVARRLGLTLAEIARAFADERAWPLAAAARISAVDAEIRTLRVKRALLRHAAQTGPLVPERYARVLAKIGA